MFSDKDVQTQQIFLSAQLQPLLQQLLQQV
jgi:hypothetical protein